MFTATPTYAIQVFALLMSYTNGICKPGTYDLTMDVEIKFLPHFYTITLTSQGFFPFYILHLRRVWVKSRNCLICRNGRNVKYNTIS